jgi:uncharacterized protein (DUF1800 family)
MKIFNWSGFLSLLAGCCVGVSAYAAPVSAVSTDAPIGLEGARHLLSRTAFAAPDAEVKAFAKLTRAEAADRLVKAANPVAVTAAPTWVGDALEVPVKMRGLTQEQRQELNRRYQEQTFVLREWWFREMLNTPSPLTEKMTLFWHNHFATSQQKVRFTPYMFNQNMTFRRNALGNFGTMLHEIARDPAMLIYLDAANSRKEQPNENFAREVMELFTLGEGHYTEKDIKEVARAFTGWSVDRDTGKYMFRRVSHDYGKKTIFDKTGDFEGDQVLDMLLARPETAQFITRKLWREFVAPVLDENEIKRMAAIYLESGYNTGKLMRTMLASDAFYAPENRAALIKSPVEFVVGTLKTFEIDPPNMRPFVLSSALLGQNLFSPPNVKGWPGGEAWINSASLLARKQLVDRLFRNEDRLDVAMRSIDEMAARNGDQPSPGRDARMRRQMDRQMGGISWNLDAWSKRYVEQRGGSGMDDLTRTVVAIAPSIPAPSRPAPAATTAPSPQNASMQASMHGANGEGAVAEWVRQLVADPAYQLK